MTNTAKERPAVISRVGQRRQIVIPRQIAEELHLDNLPLSFIQAREFVESVIECQQFRIAVPGPCFEKLQCDSATTIPLGGAACASVIDQHLAHEARSDCNEKRAVVQVGRLAANQSQASFVYERGALQGVIRAFCLEMIVGQSPEFFVDEWHEIMKRLLITMSPVAQKLGDLI